MENIIKNIILDKMVENECDSAIDTIERYAFHDMDNEMGTCDICKCSIKGKDFFDFDKYALCEKCGEILAKQAQDEYNEQHPKTDDDVHFVDIYTMQAYYAKRDGWY